MTALLASVRSSAEALDAAHAGAELIDLKEPGAGALGGVAVDEIARIVRALRAQYPVKPISATIGDLPTDAFDEIAARVIEVNAAGVDYVKVGVTPGPDARAASRCSRVCRRPWCRCCCRMTARMRNSRRSRGHSALPALSSIRPARMAARSSIASMRGRLRAASQRRARGAR